MSFYLEKQHKVEWSLQQNHSLIGAPNGRMDTVHQECF